MGIVFPENFNFPYLASSPKDFWRRWHISLSSWIRDYTLRKIGNSKGVIIPAALLSACDFADTVELRLEGRRLVIEPVKAPRCDWFEGYDAARDVDAWDDRTGTALRGKPSPTAPSPQTIRSGASSPSRPSPPIASGSGSAGRSRATAVWSRSRPMGNYFRPELARRCVRVGINHLL